MDQTIRQNNLQKDNLVISAKSDFMTIYKRSYRLAAAVFMIANIIDDNEEIKTKIKKLALNLVSDSVNLKDINFYDTKKLISSMEKSALELMSILDIASVSGLISKMNGNVLRTEFESFIQELNILMDKFNNTKNSSVGDIFSDDLSIKKISPNQEVSQLKNKNENPKMIANDHPSNPKIFSGENVDKEQKRKGMRKNTILEFIRNHNNSSIKDISPHIVGCSEKTIQRELIDLIKIGKIKKIGERRWSKYSIIDGA